MFSTNMLLKVSLGLILIRIEFVLCRDICNTTENSRLCVSIRNCPSALEDISSPVYNTVKIRRLQKITCGFDGNDPKVCCEIAELMKKETRSKITFQSGIQMLPSLEECGKICVVTTDYIIGGKTPAIGTFPWLVQIGYQEPGETNFTYFCAGTLIAKNFVLTAAHCMIVGTNPKPYIVRMGEHDSRVNPEFSTNLGLFSFVQDHKVKRIHLHSNYEETTKQNDIAIIQLVANVEFTPFIQPLCLPFVESYNLSNFSTFEFDNLKTTQHQPMAEVAGFGKVSNKENGGSKVLQYVETPLISNKECGEIYNGRAIITSKQLCAGGKAGKDSCDGDSGGSLSIFEEKTRRYFQIGIVSFGPAICGSDGYPGIYTRISAYLGWILNSVKLINNI